VAVIIIIIIIIIGEVSIVKHVLQCRRRSVCGTRSYAKSASRQRQTLAEWSYETLYTRQLIATGLQSVLMSEIGWLW